MSDYGDDGEDRYEERYEEEERDEESGSSSGSSDHEERDERRDDDRPHYENERSSEQQEYYSSGGHSQEYSSRGYDDQQSGSHGGSSGGLLGALGGGLMGGVLGAAASRFGGSSGGHSSGGHQSQGGYDGHDNRDQNYGGHREAPHAPPQGQVQFGHGAPAEYAYSYSNCTGRRKALLVGINYFGQSGQLNGCINDVHNVSTYLVEKFGYSRRDMVILTDDAQESSGQPTRHNILRAMQWLVDGAQPNDSLFFHYSGHGGSTEDKNGDEDDGNDEVIYPVDYKEAGHILDDDMHMILVNPLQAGVRLTCIFDSCHSGSALDLPYMYSTSGVVKEPNLAKEAGEGLLNVFTSANSGDYGKAASHVFNFFKQASISGDAREKTVATKTSPADVIMWSGSKDDQTSADATINAQATGAMSWAFIGAMKQNPQQSYVQLLNSIREVLATKYTQKPQLSSSHPIDTDLLFIM